MSQLTNRFRALSENLCQLLEQEGLVVRPYHLASLPFFQALTPEEQLPAIEYLERYYNLCLHTKKQRGDLREGRVLIEEALDYFKLEVDPAVFDLIGPRNVFEFYSPNQTQYFRTINFFKYTSYTIEDIYSRSWFHLYERDEKITSRILELALQVLEGKTSSFLVPEIPEHMLTERASLEKLKVPVQIICLAPLKRDGKTVGILCVVRSGGLDIERQEELESSDS
ncbi:hypothetical protein [Bdellovibrio sp. HCB2-146]|uniref:hypothetical protein n=1 Tax=Bdellovibrio sp. HCB2-146 TaxID=3394362 RepID=UPI0039BC428B